MGATLGKEAVQAGIMKRGEKTDAFAHHLEEDDLKRERHKARELRESQWWKRRLA